MRFALPLLFLLTPLVPAADPKPDPQKAAVEATNKYLAVLRTTVELLAKVSDEKSALEAKPKLDTLRDEARDARRVMFREMAELDIPEESMAYFFEQYPKILREASGRMSTEFDRIGGAKDKAAYKVLRETKLFAEIEKGYEERAAMKAQNLAGYARAWSARNEGKVPPKLEVLAEYAEEGKKALTDPWGYPYQMVLAADKDGRNRLHIWTVNPYTGKKLGTPPPEVKDEKKDK